METCITEQAAQLAASLALGVILGFVYDMLRLPRRVFPALSFLADIGFCLGAAGLLFLLAMAGGGTLRFYMPFAAGLGAAVYYAIFGRRLRPVLERAGRILRVRLARVKNILKNIGEKFKNIFSRQKKWFRIIHNTEDDRVGGAVSKSGARRARRKGEQHEATRNGHDRKTYYPGGTELRPFRDG